MPDTPAAEVAIDHRLVRRLVSAQYPRASALPLSRVADGWDCSVWRLGSDLAVRLPRRAIAAPLIDHEQRWLPGIGARLAATGVVVPAPVFAGTPSSGFPWSWSIVPWIAGVSGLAVSRHDRTGWAVPLAGALRALHVPAPDDHPRNPYRGVPLAVRFDAVPERLRAVRGAMTAASRDAIERAWAAGLDAAPWSGPPVWIHGDLHPGNVIATGPRLAGIIDFGDITAGDPAYDLAVAWLAFDAEGRSAFVAAYGPRVDAPTWTRARAWAAFVALMLLAHSDDNPPYAALGRECLAELG